MKRLFCKSGMLPGTWIILVFIALSCSKQDEGYKKVTTDIGFDKALSTVSVADTAKTYTVIELDISGINSAFAYDVYIRFDAPTVVNQLIKVSHSTYTDLATGNVYYKVPVARGVKKASVTFLPINIATGDKTFSIKLYDDVSGNNNYVLLQDRNMITVNFLDK